MRIDDYSSEELKAILSLSHQLKRTYRGDLSGASALTRPLVGKSIAAIFQKRSTRTRVSTETGMGLMGGQTLFLSSDDIQLGVNESVRDTASVLCRFNSLLLARVFGHEVVLDLAKYSDVPVINALSDLHHPLQTLADLMTLQEAFGSGLTTDSGSTPIKVAYVGDGNNIAHDLLLGCAMMNIPCSIASPKGYEIDTSIRDDILKIYAEKKQGDGIVMTENPAVAVHDADVVVTDTWVSMGQEEEAKIRLQAFEGYQVTMNMMSQGGAKKNWKFLHCLPRHQEEVDEEVFYSDRSLVFEEAENRMYTVMAVIATMLGETKPFLS